MSYKLKHDSIDDFSIVLTSRICDEFFNNQEVAHGNDLMSITGSKQTNLLLIKGLFGKWQTEMAELESPYFDFEATEVQAALSEFGKVLSKHIKIERDNLEPLLRGAIADSVYLHFDPVSFYSDRLLVNEVENVHALQESKKYLKVNAASFFETLEGQKEDAVKNKSLSKAIRMAYETDSLDMPNVSDFLNELNAPDLLDNLFEEEEKVILEEKAEVEESEEVTPKEARKVEAEENGAAINDKFNKSKKTLADELKKQVAKDIESSITLNEKIMFINSLFDGNKDEFKSALKSLETSNSYDDARAKVESSYDWDMETEEVEAFLEVLERRFA